MGQFKAGDAALIVNCKVADLIGRTVELVMALGPGEEFEATSILWINDGPDRAWIVTADGLVRMDQTGRAFPSRETLIPEHKLMPLRGDFAPLEQKSQAVQA